MGEWAGGPSCRSCLSVISRVTYREDSMGVGIACLAQHVLVPWTMFAFAYGFVARHGECEVVLLGPQSGAVVMTSTEIGTGSEGIWWKQGVQPSEVGCLPELCGHCGLLRGREGGGAVPDPSRSPCCPVPSGCSPFLQHRESYLTGLYTTGYVYVPDGLVSDSLVGGECRRGSCGAGLSRRSCWPWA